MKKSVWQDHEFLTAAIRQIAIDNGTPNVMPTLEQMKTYPGLMSWVRKKAGGVHKLSQDLNMVIKPNVLPETNVPPTTHKLVIGSTVFVHNKRRVCSAIVMDKGNEPGAIFVLMHDKKLCRRHVKYGKVGTNKYQWCYPKDMPREIVTIVV